MQRAMAVASLALRRLAAAAASSQALAAASIRCPVAAAPSLFVAQPPAVGAAAIDFRRGYAARGGARKAKAVSEDGEEFDENDAEPFDSDVMEDFDDDDMEGFDEEEGDFDEEEELEMKGGRGKR